MNTTLVRLFNLRRDQDHPDAIDADIRAGAQPVGANLWVLIFAILIASVGLNVNSTAVIVGAMLISPLMGPILALGYGAAVHDLKLIRDGAKTLGMFTVISLVSSTLYFVLSPLDQPGSELLARTSPTLWDVLIAAFGGAAGMIAATRKEVSNVVPGVAIATALMPPLCTAGFGMANGRWDMVGGAAYLFVINGVFIGVATLTIAKLMRLPRRGQLDPSVRRRHRFIIATGITLVVAPSVWLGYAFVQNEVFQTGARRVLDQIQNQPQFNVVAQQVDPQSRTLRLTLIGGFDEDRLREVAGTLMASAGLKDATLDIRRAGDAPVDLGQLRNQLKQDVDKGMLQQLQINEAKLAVLEKTVQRSLQTQLALPAVDPVALHAEVQAQVPQLRALTLAHGTRLQNGSDSQREASVVSLELSRPMPKAQRDALERWLKVRLARNDVQLIETIVRRG